MSADIEKWINSGQHLPEFMRDFHDTKDLFRFLDSIQRDTINYGNRLGFGKNHYVNPIDAHIYVIDVFLHILARRGYTLQRTKKKLPFRNIKWDVDSFKESELLKMVNLMKTEK